MSLQGTLADFEMPVVLGLLANTKKTGELRLASPQMNGSIWLDTGQLVGAEIPKAPTLVDAVFEILRLETGNFQFVADSPVRVPMPPEQVGDVLADAEERMVEWRDISAVVPGLNVVIGMIADPPTPQIVIENHQWKLLVGLAHGIPLASVADVLHLGEFDACRTVKQLAEIGIISVEPTPAAAAAKPAPAQPAPAPAQPAPAAPPPPAADQPAAAPAPPEAVPDAPAADAAAAPAPGSPDEQVDRGALLKFLSSVRN